MFSISWIILGIISLVFLIIYWGKGQNSIWGGLTMGIIAGLILAIFKQGFNWYFILKGGIIGILLGSIL